MHCRGDDQSLLKLSDLWTLWTLSFNVNGCE
jgi:hypothetical protein